jgi:iron complex outermembrane receptor protein
MRRIFIGALAGAWVLGAQAAAAQTAPVQTNTGASADELSEIVVTGTLIRGEPPTGVEFTKVTSEEITQLGVVDTSQLLGFLPQDTYFNGRPQVGSFGAFQTVNAPLLRYLGGGSSGSNSTLLLLDGVRLPGMGIQQTSADIDAIAPRALASVDMIPDGGSAIYGSDAVGGVINLNSLRKFDGLEVGGHYGGASHYGQWDANATAGKIWDGMSAWISFDDTHHNLILNGDRDYVHDLNYTTTPPTGAYTSCNPGNFTAGGYVLIPTPPYYKLVTTVYPISKGGVPTIGPPNTCDLAAGTTFFPEESRYSFMTGFDYDIASWLTFDFRGYYMHRDASNQGGPNAYSGVPATATIDGFPASGTVTGLFTQPPFATTPGDTTTETWGVIPRLKAQLGHDWQLDWFGNVGLGKAQAQSQTAGGNQPLLATQTASGAFNPFTGAFAATPAGQAAEASQANYYGFSSGHDKIYNSRAVFDGPLFALPGGSLRMAAGGEYFDEQFIQRNGNAEIGDFDSIPAHPISRTVKSAFGELLVPIVGEKNNITGIDEVTFSAAGRYDHYSDFGGTFNPKLSLSYKPLSWWTLRGNWGKSFQAPSLASTAGAIPPGVVTFPAGLFGANPAYPNTTGLTTLLLYPGGGLDLQPQTARTWEIGTDLKVPFVQGMTASLTYYYIDFANRIATPAFYEASFYSLYPNSYIMNTPSAPFTSAQIANYIASAYNKAQVAQYVNNPNSVYALENGLSQNLSAVTTSGLDFSANYKYPTDFGSLYAGEAGTYILTYNTQATPTSTYQDLDANSVARVHMSTTAGASWNNVFGGTLSAQAMWNKTGGNSVLAFPGNAFQSRVDAFNVVNLAFVYTGKPNSGALQGTTFTLNFDNVFNKDPPTLNGGNGNQEGYQGFTLGRFINFGAEKKF